ncbi:MAG TPA: pilus assembly protein TadG-related protein [Clostridia bacterium]|nr:pilus assembly protein TadG-related protein [Clostridia bacterium]
MHLSFRSKKGSTAIMIAVMMSAILGFCALVIDIGRVSLYKNTMQNAVDSAALAAAQDLPDTAAAVNTAENYLNLNGFGSADKNIVFADSNRQITVEAIENMNYTFARILGINSTAVKTKASAEKGGRYLRGAFDYAVFSGSRNDELCINSNGQATHIVGSVHSNNGFRYNGNHDPIEITGAVDTVGRITLNGDQVSIGEQLPFGEAVQMPDFSEEIRQLAQTAGTYYNTSQNFNSDIFLNTAIYVNGHINFNCNQFSGIGTIMATDNIIFNNSVVYDAAEESSICIYSQYGDITINNTSAVVNGTFYAPNGTVIFNNGAHTVNGRIIAKRLIFNGGLDVLSSDSDTLFTSTFDESVRLIR